VQVGLARRPQDREPAAAGAHFGSVLYALVAYPGRDSATAREQNEERGLHALTATTGVLRRICAGDVGTQQAVPATHDLCRRRDFQSCTGCNTRWLAGTRGEGHTCKNRGSGCAARPRDPRRRRRGRRRRGRAVRRRAGRRAATGAGHQPGRRGWLREAKRRLDDKRADEARPIPRSRPERLRESTRRLEEEHRVECQANADYEAYRARGVMRDGRRFGAPPKPYQPPEVPARQVNVTDPDSRNVKRRAATCRATRPGGGQRAPDRRGGGD
jgi:hypothetical protein